MQAHAHVSNLGAEPRDTGGHSLRPCNFFCSGKCTTGVALGDACKWGSHHPAFLLRVPTDQRWKTTPSLQQWALSLPEWTTAWDKERTQVFENAHRVVTKAGDGHQWYALAKHSERQKRTKAQEAVAEEERRRVRELQPAGGHLLQAHVHPADGHGKNARGGGEGWAQLSAEQAELQATYPPVREEHVVFHHVNV